MIDSPGIVDEFLDVSFPDFEEYTFGDLGYEMPQGTKSYEEKFGSLTDKEIDECIEAMDADGGGMDKLVTRIFNQKQEGSCVANACSQAHQICQALMLGKEEVTQLSAISLYKRIGSSPNSGATVSGGLKEMQNKGILPLDTPENREKFDHVMPNTGYYTRYPSGWQDTAALFAGVEADVVTSVGGIFTAVCNMHPVVVGRQGHSICYCRAMKKNGRRVMKYANSWHERWGDKGYGYDSESQIRMSARWAFALRTVTLWDYE